MNSKDKVFSLPDKERTKIIMIYGILSTVVFAMIYGWCNKQATLSPIHYQMYTDWELSLPLIPWMIYPYISLNLLFIVCAFVLKETSSLKGFCISLMISAILAAIVFYYFPGKLGFIRQSVLGYETLYNFMFSIDHPHNLFPSLHVTYSSLAIFSMIEQTKNKFFHVFSWTWLIIISASVILVHQHHLFDIAAGFILALFVHKFVYLKFQSIKKA